MRALTVVAEDQIAAPRRLLEYLEFIHKPVELDTLASRQGGLVGEGLRNARIDERPSLGSARRKPNVGRSVFEHDGDLWLGRRRLTRPVYNRLHRSYTALVGMGGAHAGPVSEQQGSRDPRRFVLPANNP